MARRLRQVAYRLDPVYYRRETPCQDYDQMIARMDQLIIERKLYCDKSLSIDGMAARMGTNRTSLSRALRSRDLTFNTYVNKYRIWYAASRLARNSAMDISEVAEASGFSSVRSLRYYINRQYGITLTEFRQRIFRLLSELQAKQKRRRGRKGGSRCRQQL